jgi:hypothetical protein
MKYIIILYVFGIVNVDSFLYILGQLFLSNRGIRSCINLMRPVLVQLNASTVSLSQLAIRIKILFSYLVERERR